MCKCFFLGTALGMAAGLAVSMLSTPKKKRPCDLLRLANDVMEVFR